MPLPREIEKLIGTGNLALVLLLDAIGNHTREAPFGSATRVCTDASAIPRFGSGKYKRIVKYG